MKNTKKKKRKFKGGKAKKNSSKYRHRYIFYYKKVDIVSVSILCHLAAANKNNKQQSNKESSRMYVRSTKRFYCNF